MPRLRQLSTGDRRALCVLVGAPLVVFVLPALLGYPLLTGDDIIQNYPLRALAGEMLRHGHLPIYDPFEWSGSALLGGINAGAAFPAMALFVVLPPLAAWVATEVVAFAATAVGLYAFLRCCRIRPLAATLGAAAFGLTGFVSSQAVHIDVVEASASLAWLLVGLERTAHGPRRARPRWAALAAFAAACLGLSGSPEVAFYAAVGASVYAAHLVLHAGGDRWRLVGVLALACAIGLLLAGVQIVPGAEVVLTSQRADTGTGFLTAGSLDGAQLLTLLAPHLLGGGPIGLRGYVGSYNLAEIDAYPGMLALAATASLAVRWRASGAKRWRVWYLVGGLGLLVALGKATPLPHLLAHMPVIGSSRLPSRALVLYALASSVLLAYWVDDLVGSDDAGPGGTSAGASRGARLAALAGATPPAAVLALLLVVAVGGPRVARVLAGGPIGSWSVAAIAPYLVIAGAIAIGTGALALLGHRLGRRRRCALLVGLALADALAFTVDQSSLAPTYARAVGQPSALSRSLARLLGPDGRFVVVDPARSGGITLDELGAPDLNGLSRLASAQGYGSLSWGPYAAATGTHGQDVAAPAAVAGSVFDSLDVRALLVTSAAFETPLRRGSSAAAHDTATLDLRQGGSETRYFGAVERVVSVSLRLPPRSAVAATDPGDLAGALRLVGAGGGVETESPRVTTTGRTVEATFPGGARAAGLEISDPLAEGIPELGVVVTLASGRRFAPTGPLAAAASPPHWRLEGTIGGQYAVLRDTRAKARYSLARGAAGVAGAAGAIAAVREVRTTSWGTSETVSVDAAQRFTLVRGVADIPGWSARLVGPNGSLDAPVRRDGVVQSVELPAGRYEVTFTYDAPGLDAGLASSAAGCAAMLALLAAGLTRYRRDRRHGDRPPRASRTRARARPRPGRALTRRREGAGILATLLTAAALASACGGGKAATGGTGPRPGATSRATTPTTAATTQASSTTSTAPPSGGGTAPEAPLGSGMVPGKVTAIGDSVMLDYSALLAAELPHTAVAAAVGRQWLSGVDLVRQLRSDDLLGATVVVALGTNGPVTAGNFDSMMAALSGARRIVLVTVHVDEPWQGEVNAVLRAGARRYSNIVIADWAALAAKHPGWFYADGTHLPIGGPGAHALAALVARAAR